LPFIPLYGHEELRARLLDRVRDGTLPQSLLLHGPAGVGKQRLALWLGQALICGTPLVPCGTCQQCRYAAELQHPDLTWIFPRPRLKDSDTDLDDIKYDLASAVKSRVDVNGLYSAPPASEGIYVGVVRFLVRQAALTPAMSSRKVFVVGDADRMVQQEGSEFAANALLKMLEEPPADTWMILTTTAMGALLPTIRSRVVAVRVPLVAAATVRAFVTDPLVAPVLDRLELPKDIDERVVLAGGAPGKLLATSLRQGSMDEARRLLDAAAGGQRAQLLKLALSQGTSGARGAFSDLLDALTVALHERMRTGTERSDDLRALAASRAIDLVEDAKLLAEGNVSPQLITAKLLRDLAGTLA
jgi:DNA polymerase III subunit delta'